MASASPGRHSPPACPASQTLQRDSARGPQPVRGDTIPRQQQPLPLASLSLPGRRRLPPPPLTGRRRLLLPATRPSNPDKDYHDISFVYDALREIRGNEAAAERIGRKLCKLLMGLNWFWVSTTMDTRFFSDSKLAWRVTCRRTGLPRNAVLMW